MSKHTQGPWVVGKYEFDAHYVYAGKFLICDMNRVHPELRIAANDNARLIAAAPDLLEALQSCAGMLAVFVDDGTAAHDSVIGKNLTMARAAIAKATGSQP